MNKNPLPDNIAPDAWLMCELADAPVPFASMNSATTVAEDDVRHTGTVLERFLKLPFREALRSFRRQISEPSNAETVRQALSQRREGSFDPFELTLRDSQDALLRATVIPRPLYDAAGALTACASTLLPGPASQASATQTPHESVHADVEKYKTLLTSFPIGIVVFNDQGEVLESNPASERILGISQEEQTKLFPNKHPFRFIHVDGTEPDVDELPGPQASKTNKIVEAPLIGLVRPDQTTLWLHIIAAPIPLPGYGAAVAFIDITDSYTMQMKYKEVESRFETMVRDMPVLIAAYDADNDICFWNRECENVTGFSSDELVDTPGSLQKIFPDPGYRAMLIQEKDRCGGDFRDWELTVTCKDGFERIISWSDISREFPLPGRAHWLVGVDITDRKEHEQTADIERRRLFNLLDRLPVFVCLIAPDYSIRFSNRFFKDQFGTPGEAPCYRIMNKRDDPCPFCPGFDVFDTGHMSVWEWECRHLDKTFEVYDYPFEDVDGSPLVLELGIDITRSKMAQEALRASEQRYRSISDNLILGIAVINKDMRVTAVNPKVEEWFPEFDCSHTPTWSHAFPDFGETDHCLIDGRLTTFDTGKTCETVMTIGMAEKIRHLNITFCPIFDDSGSVASVIALMDDVTEKLQVQSRLQRVQKLEAMGTLAGGIAHEINQPLNALQLYLSGLEMLVEKNKGLTTSTLLERLSWMMSEVGKIKDIINHMRALVHQDHSANVGRASVNTAVTSALHLIGAQLKAHNVRVDLHPTKDLPDAAANSVQLEQVVINLVINSMQALDTLDIADKRISIHTRPPCEATDNRILISVMDNGPGLKGMEDRIFNPFFTTKDAGKGMGLGLSIIHTFVGSWGGEITAGARENQGAVFNVYLKPYDDPVPPADTNGDKQ